MTPPAQPSRKPRKWIWFLGGIAGAFLFGGWEPFFLQGWWYGMFRDASVGGDFLNSYGPFITWLLIFPLSGFLIGCFLFRWMDKKFIQASDE
ncbi:MAG: hypothetical protein WC028_20120 [Candidatus Obscuribacterales bacterium]|jgi:hypothetical protein